MNFNAGPWASQAWFHEQLHSMSEAVTALSVDDPMLVDMWENIHRDFMGSQEAHECGITNDREGRTGWLKLLAESPELSRVGVKVSCSRWFSWFTHHSERDRFHHTLLFFRHRMALRRNKVVLGVAPGADAAVADRDDSRTAAPASSGVTPGGSASSSGPVPEATSSAARVGGRESLQRSREKLADLRSRCAGTLELAITIAAEDEDFLKVSRLIGLVGTAEHRAYTALTRMVRSETEWLSLDQQCRWAQMDWHHSLLEVTGALNNVDALRRLGIHFVETDLPERDMADRDFHVAVDEHYLSTLFSLCDRVIARRLASMLLTAE
eukprot:821497-Amphidinium_carterae.1